MKTATIILAFAVVTLSACGEGEVSEYKEQYSCECTATCNGEQTSVTDDVCELPSKMQESAASAVEACDDDLAGTCDTHACECVCTPTGEGC